MSFKVVSVTFRVKKNALFSMRVLLSSQTDLLTFEWPPSLLSNYWNSGSDGN